MIQQHPSDKGIPAINQRTRTSSSEQTARHLDTTTFTMQKKMNALHAVDSMRRFSRTLSAVLADERPIPKPESSQRSSAGGSSSSKTAAMRRRAMTERRKSRAKQHWKRVQRDMMSASVAAFSVAGQERRNAYVGKPWATIGNLPSHTVPEETGNDDVQQEVTPEDNHDERRTSIRSLRYNQKYVGLRLRACGNVIKPIYC